MEYQLLLVKGRVTRLTEFSRYELSKEVVPRTEVESIHSSNFEEEEEVWEKKEIWVSLLLLLLLLLTMMLEKEKEAGKYFVSHLI